MNPIFIFVLIVVAITGSVCTILSAVDTKNNTTTNKNTKKVKNTKTPVQGAEQLMPKVRSSAFYKEVAPFLQQGLSKGEKNIRSMVDERYHNYLQSGQSKPFDPYEPYGSHIQSYYLAVSVCVEKSKISYRTCDYAFDREFVCAEHGYADLTAAQLYALVRILLQDYDSIFRYDVGIAPGQTIEWNIFDAQIQVVDLVLTDQYIKKIVDSEVRVLQAKKSPYKNAF